MNDVQSQTRGVSRRKLMGTGTAVLVGATGAERLGAQRKQTSATGESGAGAVQTERRRRAPASVHAGIGSAGCPVELSFLDYGKGKPVVLIHGWPLCKESWEQQLAELPKHMRVIPYDRRGFGKSSKPWDGYDSDTSGRRLKAVLDQLDLQDVTLVGFSMGGCELARYMSRHNGGRVGKVVFVSDVTPYLKKTADNPEGKDAAIFTNMIARVERDRPLYLAEFFRTYYAVGAPIPVIDPASQLFLDWNLSWTLQASCRATTECVTTFSASEYRQDYPRSEFQHYSFMAAAIP